MRPGTTNSPGTYLIGLAAVFLALPVALFWRPGLFFFMEDDWVVLSQLVSYPFWSFLTRPDAESWLPVSRAVYYGLVSAFGERYSALLLINCLGCGSVAFLFYLFLRRHFSSGLALGLGLLYASSAAQTSLAQVAYYLNAVFCYAFFLLALLLTDQYLRTPSRLCLGGIALGAALSIFSWNFTLMALWALPLYLAILGGKEERRKFFAVGVVVGLALLAFALLYFIFAGFGAAASHNRGIMASLPGPAYLLHWFFGACLSPFFYLFWGHYHYPVWAYALGGGALVLSLGLIWGWGDLKERRLGLWALTLNALPFILVSLARYQRSVDQAFAPRYAAFTLMGALIILGTAWGILKRRMRPGLLTRLLPLAVLAVMVAGQIFSLSGWERLYGQMSRDSRDYYQRLEVAGPGGPAAAGELVPPQSWYPERLRLTRGQVASIRRFLSGTPEASGGPRS